jgi:hypothetical protein
MKKAAKEEKTVKAAKESDAQKTAKIKETDLYEPINKFLTMQGYTVHSEVKNCDVAAMKGDELVIIEMKTAFNLKLLTQAAKRQRSADSVYVAIPRPKGGKKGSAWRDMCFLLRRLEVGLILVDVSGKEPPVEVIFHPNTFDRLKSTQSGKRVRRSIIKEAEARYGDFNKGGSTKCRIMTAYKENCLHIACCLDKMGTLSPAQLKKLGTGKKTQSILSKNFYGLYEKVGKGKYALHPSARGFLDSYPELAGHYYGKIEEVPAEV